MTRVMFWFYPLLKTIIIINSDKIPLHSPKASPGVYLIWGRFFYRLGCYSLFYKWNTTPPYRLPCYGIPVMDWQGADIGRTWWRGRGLLRACVMLGIANICQHLWYSVILSCFITPGIAPSAAVKRFTRNKKNRLWMSFDILPVFYFVRTMLQSDHENHWTRHSISRNTISQKRVF